MEPYLPLIVYVVCPTQGETGEERRKGGGRMEAILLLSSSHQRQQTHASSHEQEDQTRRTPFSETATHPPYSQKRERGGGTETQWREE